MSAQNSDVRAMNRRLVLDTIRRGPVSRTDIARKLGLTKASVTYIIDEMLKEGLIEETGTAHSEKGRNPILLELRCNAVRFAGINLERERIEAGVISLSGEASLQFEQAYTQEAPEVQLARVSDRLKEAGPFNAVGVCAPGPLDYHTGVILNPARFDRWHGFPVAEFLRSRLHCLVYLENVSSAAALEEMYFGLAASLDSFMVLLVISGIGAGVVINRKLLRGIRGLGNEIGHTSIDYAGIPCACGNRGCLERYAAIPTIMEGTRFHTWAEVVRDESTDARALVKREAEYLSCALVNMVNMLDVDQIILKGLIADNAGEICEIIRKNLIQRSIAGNHADSLRVMAHAETQPVRAAAIPAIHAFFQGANP